MFGVPARQIQEIICLGDLESVPALPKRLTGPVKVIGKVLSLVKLPVPFVRPQGEFELTTRTCILVLKAHSAISDKISKGVVVDRVEHLIELAPEDIETVTTQRGGLWSAYTLGFAKRHLPVVLIDLQQLILSQPGQYVGTPFRPDAGCDTAVLRRRAQKAP